MGDLIIAGDFNIHVNDVDRLELDSSLMLWKPWALTSLWIFCTHKSGNILDLMFTCIGNKIKCEISNQMALFQIIVLSNYNYIWLKINIV